MGKLKSIKVVGCEKKLRGLGVAEAWTSGGGWGGERRLVRDRWLANEGLGTFPLPQLSPYIPGGIWKASIYLRASTRTSSACLGQSVGFLKWLTGTRLNSGSCFSEKPLQDGRQLTQAAHS